MLNKWQPLLLFGVYLYLVNEAQVADRLTEESDEMREGIGLRNTNIWEKGGEMSAPDRTLFWFQNQPQART